MVVINTGIYYGNNNTFAWLGLIRIKNTIIINVKVIPCLYCLYFLKAPEIWIILAPTTLSPIVRIALWIVKARILRGIPPSWYSDTYV